MRQSFSYFILLLVLASFSACKKKGSKKSIPGSDTNSLLTNEGCTPFTTEAIETIPVSSLGLTDLSLASSDVNVSSDSLTKRTASTYIGITKEMHPATFTMVKICKKEDSECDKKNNFVRGYDDFGNIPNLPLGPLLITIKGCVDNKDFIEGSANLGISNECTDAAPCYCGSPVVISYVNNDDPKDADPFFLELSQEYIREKTKLYNIAAAYSKKARDFVNTCSVEENTEREYAQNIANLSSAELASFSDSYGEELASVMYAESQRSLQTLALGPGSEAASPAVAEDNPCAPAPEVKGEFGNTLEDYWEGDASGIFDDSEEVVYSASEEAQFENPLAYGSMDFGDPGEEANAEVGEGDEEDQAPVDYGATAEDEDPGGGEEEGLAEEFAGTAETEGGEEKKKSSNKKYLIMGLGAAGSIGVGMAVYFGVKVYRKKSRVSGISDGIKNLGKRIRGLRQSSRTTKPSADALENAGEMQAELEKSSDRPNATPEDNNGMQQAEDRNQTQTQSAADDFQSAAGSASDEGGHASRSEAKEAELRAAQAEGPEKDFWEGEAQFKTGEADLFEAQQRYFMAKAYNAEEEIKNAEEEMKNAEEKMREGLKKQSKAWSQLAETEVADAKTRAEIEEAIRNEQKAKQALDVEENNHKLALEEVEKLKVERNTFVERFKTIGPEIGTLTAKQAQQKSRIDLEIERQQILTENGLKVSDLNNTTKVEEILQKLDAEDKADYEQLVKELDEIDSDAAKLNELTQEYQSNMEKMNELDEELKAAEKSAQEAEAKYNEAKEAYKEPKSRYDEIGGKHPLATGMLASKAEIDTRIANLPNEVKTTPAAVANTLDITSTTTASSSSSAKPASSVVTETKVSGSVFDRVRSFFSIKPSSAALPTKSPPVTAASGSSAKKGSGFLNSLGRVISLEGSCQSFRQTSIEMETRLYYQAKIVRELRDQVHAAKLSTLP